MKYSLRDLPALLRTPLGRQRIVSGFRYRAFPLLARLAKVRRRHQLKNTCIVAVVGSLGKTTTMRIATAALGMGLERCSTNNQFSGLALYMLRQIPAGAAFQVMEVGIGAPGQMARYADMMQPDIAVVTSIAAEHREELLSDETTRHEKAFMVRVLPENGTAVLNGDDENVMWMAGETRARVVTFGLDKGNDLRASDIETCWPEGTRFQLHCNGQTRTVETRLTGWPMIYAALGGLAVAWVAGRDLDQAVADISRVEPKEARLAPVSLPSGAWLIEDTYKSPLESMFAALDALESADANRKIIVFGDAPVFEGDPGDVYRDLATRMSALADRVYIMGERFGDYVEGARSAGVGHAHFMDRGYDLFALADELNTELGQGDVVLIKGYYLHLERLALLLSGEVVKCALKTCEGNLNCRTCPMVSIGWGNKRVLT